MEAGFLFQLLSGGMLVAAQGPAGVLLLPVLLAGGLL